MELLIQFTNLIRLGLISMTIFSTSTLVWRILKRKALHTLFNLGWCFFFIITGTISPFIFNEYFGLLNDMILHPDQTYPERCQALYLYRMLSIQATKVILLNLIFRYIIIQFSHYGLGLSYSFANAGIKHWVLRFTYFTLLFTYVGVSSFNVVFKSYQVEMMEKIVKGRICLLMRFVDF